LRYKSKAAEAAYSLNFKPGAIALQSHEAD